MFKFLKNKNLNPPDIGEEDSSEIVEEKEDSPFNFSKDDENLDTEKKKKGKFSIKTGKKDEIDRLDVIENKKSNFKSNSSDKSIQYNPELSDVLTQKNSLEIEKISAKLEIINSLINAFDERFSLINQQLGEVRAATVSNEKNLSLFDLDAKKVIEVVKELDPSKLSESYQKVNLKVETLSEKLESYSQFLNSLTEDIKEIKRKANLFEGTDALLKLNEDVKKDLIEIQKVNNHVRMNADKSEQIFIELSKKSKEDETIKERILNLESSFANISKNFKKINLIQSQSLNIKDFNDFKVTTKVQLESIKNDLLELDKLKDENSKLFVSLEKIINMEKKNEESITLISKERYDNWEKKIKENENKINSILTLLEKMAIEINKLKSGFWTNLGKEKKISENLLNKPQINSLNPLFSESERQIEILVQEGEKFLLNNELMKAVEVYQKILGLYSPIKDTALNLYDPSNPIKDTALGLYHTILNFYDNLIRFLAKNSFTNETNQTKSLNEPLSETESQIPLKKFKKLSDY
ncbi:hypothetical protein GYA25_02530 [Candidatus Woesearchaeota archaeon]|nr:hypothetical protein [Candidatus Woesearchaeota archaeon]